MNVGSHRITITLAVLLCLASGCEKAPTPIQRAEASYEAGDWHSTVDICSSILASDPIHEKSLYFRGQSYVALGMYQEAIADFTAYIDLDTSDPERRYLRKMAYQRAGLEKLAEADGAKGRSMDSQYKSAYQFDPSNFSPKIRLDFTRNGSSDDEDPDAEDDADTRDQRKEEIAKDDSEPERPRLYPPPNESLAQTEQSESQTAPPTGSSNGNPISNFGGGATNDSVTTVQPPPNAANVPTVDVPAAPPSPAMPGKDTLVVDSPVSDTDRLVPNEGNFHQQWVAEQRALAEEKRTDEPKDADLEEESEETASAGPLQQFTTSLPPSFTNPKSRPKSPNYMPSVPGLGAQFDVSGARATGINSSAAAKFPKGPPTTGIKSIPNPALAAGPNKGIRPGEFRGNTLYQTGKKVTLSTSIPGTKTVNGTAPTPRKLPDLLRSPPPVIRKGKLPTTRSKAKKKLGSQLPAAAREVAPQPVPK